jgi:predicted enzyme related to lactoylglutathione lyase
VTFVQHPGGAAMTTTGFQSIVYPVRDLEAAKAVYAALLGQPHTDQPYYVGFNVDGQEVGLNPHGHQQGMTGPVGYWQVDDVTAAVDALVAAGGEAKGEPQDVGGGTLIATVTDADGNPIGLIQKT